MRAPKLERDVTAVSSDAADGTTKFADVELKQTLFRRSEHVL